MDECKCFVQVLYPALIASRSTARQTWWLQVVPSQSLVASQRWREQRWGVKQLGLGVGRLRQAVALTRIGLMRWV
ncbi:MAG TPA: hypothetical protein DEF45_10285 [Rhodopirellula sp.]|nr:hypothetical protein [Rhodopirellula sp.]